MKRYNAGIIGCGNIGSGYDERKSRAVYTHAGMYRSLKYFKLVCAADIDPVRLEEFGRYWQIKNLYQDYRKLLKNESLDILSLATPDETHCRIILDILKLNPPRMIFTEKPLASDTESARKIYLECRKKNVKLVIDYVRRWDKNHQRVQEFIREGGLGKIKSVIGYYVRGLRHNGCQMINLVQFFFGRITHAQAVGEYGKGSIIGDPSLNARFITEKGIPVNIVALDQDRYSFSIFELDIFSTAGRLRLTDNGSHIKFYKVKANPNFPNFKTLKLQAGSWKKTTYKKAMVRAAEELFAFLSGKKRRLHNTDEEALNDLAVIEAVLRSARTANSLVKVELIR